MKQKAGAINIKARARQNQRAEKRKTSAVVSPAGWQPAHIRIGRINACFRFILHTCVLQIVFLFVLSDHLQVFDVLITLAALHFSSCEIHGLEGLSKVTMTEKAILKAYN